MHLYEPFTDHSEQFAKLHQMDRWKRDIFFFAAEHSFTLRFIYLMKFRKLKKVELMDWACDRLAHKIINFPSKVLK